MDGSHQATIVDSCFNIVQITQHNRDDGLRQVISWVLRETGPTQPSVAEV